MRQLVKLLIGIVALIVGLEATESSAAIATYDDNARAVVSRAIAARDSMKTVYLEIQTTRTRPANTEAVSTQIWYTRPDHLLIVERAGQIATSMYVNKDEFIGYNHPPRNDYLRRKTEGSIAAYAAASSSIPIVGAVLFLSDAPVLPLKDQAVTYTGQETVAGTPCHVIATSTPELDYRFWFDGNGPMKKSVMTGRGAKAGLRVESVFRVVSNQAIPDSTYVFTPPPGSKEQKNTPEP